MQAPHRLSVQPHWPSRLLLWLAAGLFLFQVALHASTPADRNMAEWLNTVLTGSMSVNVHSGQMADMPDMPGASPASGGFPGGHSSGNHSSGNQPAGHQSHAHHAEGLCCMPPAALLPGLWAPPPLPLSRATLTPPKVLHEAQMLLRATARGPPLGRATSVQAV
ncbi:hypothetical protein [Deinococcus altitudinis]|uniref:hypothetical protein n=1 Tax=Deinococcus altitudinis TaxID=468914 RepID=UPI003891426E